MKLLLTSNGLSNPSIAKAFQELIGKEPKDSKVAFIPTAAHSFSSNKFWLIDDLYRIKQQGYYVDIVDLTAVKKDRLTSILEPMDAIFFGGGNTFYLSYWLQQSGLFELLPELLETKVYAGISAGSIIAGKSMVLASQAMKNPKAFEDEDYELLNPGGEASTKTLGLVDFIFRPHLNSPNSPWATKESLENKAKDIKNKIYALDDNSALKVVDDKVEVVTEGEWLALNN
jgi:dipeptidase E